MTNPEVLKQELQKINEILEDHLMQRDMDRAFGYVQPLLPEEQEYLFEICHRKHEIQKLLKAGQEE